MRTHALLFWGQDWTVTRKNWLGFVSAQNDFASGESSGEEVGWSWAGL